MIFKKSNEAAQKRTAKISTDPKERMQAIEGISDQKFLFEVATHDNDFGVSKAAVERITEQSYLMAIGKDNAAKDWCCRKAAISRMNDKVALQYIVDN